MSVDDLLQLPVPAASLARVLESHRDYRVLRRIHRMVRGEVGFHRTDEMCVCILDCETTGTDHQTDRIIELAVQRIYVAADGSVAMTGKPRSWLEDPEMPIPAEVSRITGLTDSDVKGKTICQGEAHGIISSADAVLSHNARFDRPFVEKRLGLSGLAWICSLNDLDWREWRFEGRSLSQLLCQCGWFYKAHRAAADVNALLHLLDHRLCTDGTVLKELIERARRPSWVVDAVGAPFSARGVLKARGYRWDPGLGFWSKEVLEQALEDELGWASVHVYGGLDTPSHRAITWTERYAARD